MRHKLTDEEKFILGNLRTHGKPIERERACQIVSIILHSIPQPLFRRGNSVLDRLDTQPDSYLGEHAIRETLDSLEAQGYLVRDEQGLVAPSDIIPVDLYIGSQFSLNPRKL